jgi:hypothetical protein
LIHTQSVKLPNQKSPHNFLPKDKLASASSFQDTSEKEERKLTKVKKDKPNIPKVDNLMTSDENDQSVEPIFNDQGTKLNEEDEQANDFMQIKSLKKQKKDLGENSIDDLDFFGTTNENVVQEQSSGKHNIKPLEEAKTQIKVKPIPAPTSNLDADFQFEQLEDMGDLIDSDFD